MKRQCFNTANQHLALIGGLPHCANAVQPISHPVPHMPQQGGNRSAVFRDASSVSVSLSCENYLVIEQIALLSDRYLRADVVAI